MAVQPLDELAVFRIAFRIESDELREDYLRQACGEDEQLYSRVAAILKANADSQKFLESPINEVAATMDFVPIAVRPGTEIGAYKLLEGIGEGGMGVVYMAQQREPVRRKVALKIIKPGMDTREVIARFQAEEQALAMMDHPNIAKVHDAGTTESGRPYFAMELVNGVPITQYADDNNLTTDQRLELFISVCNAVQHAHQKGIIHRDIKPSNILITLQDGVPVPKIIDFGIAKAINQELATRTLATGLGQMVGTPLYMSPEQAERSGLDIDTRSDIYSLGVLLYELLTGSTPFDREQLQGAGLEEIRRLIREQEPRRPSTRISTLGKAATAVSQHRRTDPIELSRTLRYELDWIVMKALEKDRTRRYETASDFARDIERYLRDEPVEACPPSRRYRVGKFVRRNKAALIVSSGLVMGIVCLLIGTSLAALAQREIAQRRLRVQGGINNTLAEVAQLRRASTDATGTHDANLLKAREKLQFAVGLVESGSADHDLIASVQTLQQVLDEEQAALAQDQRDRELVAALEAAWRLQANVDLAESRFAKEDCVPHIRKALEDYGITICDDSPEGVAAFIVSRPETVRIHVLDALEEIRRLARPIIGISWKVTNGNPIIIQIAPGSPAEHDGRLREGDKLVGVGQGRDGDVVDIESLSQQEIGELLRGEPGSIVQLKVISNGETEPQVYDIQRDPTPAWLRDVLELADRDPWRKRLRTVLDLKDEDKQLKSLIEMAEQVDVSTQSVRVMTRLGFNLASLGARDVAIRLLRRVQKVYPDDLWANSNLADVLRNNRPPQYEEAIRYSTAAIALRPSSAGLHINLGASLHYVGRLEEAIEEYRECLRLAPRYAHARCSLVNNLIELGKSEEAEAVAREAVELFPESAAFHCNLGSALWKLGKEEESAAVYRKALQLDPNLIDAHDVIARDLLRKGQREEALEKFREVVAMDPTNGRSHYHLGVALGMLERIDEASHAYREALRLEPDNIPALVNLKNILVRQGKPEDAVAIYREALAFNPESCENHGNFGVLLADLGNHDEAVAEYREAIRLLPSAIHPRINLGNLLSRLGKHAEALVEFREAARLSDGNPQSLNNLAWLLVTWPEPTQLDLEKALQLAEKAVGISQKVGAHWNTLGVARYRTGDFAGAIEALCKAEELWPNAIFAWNAFFLAMAHWQQGDQQEARQWYQRAVKWTDENKHGEREEQLRRFRSEAEQLMGIEGSQAPDPAAKDDRQQEPSAESSRPEKDG
jgi:serine/threonine protein kinase/tetratricopeptide (TPR) repeat protein